MLGVSTGGALALEAAAAGAGIDRLAVYEVPYYVPGWDEYVATITALLADGRRDEALEHFMRTAGSSDESIAGARASAYWPGLLRAGAHARVRRRVPRGQPAAGRRRAARARAHGRRRASSSKAPPTRWREALPNAERDTIPNQGHVADPKALAAVLQRFYSWPG